MSTPYWIAKRNGFEEPIEEIAPGVIRAHDPEMNDVAFLRFVEGRVYVYSYKYELDLRPKIY